MVEQGELALFYYTWDYFTFQFHELAIRKINFSINDQIYWSWEKYIFPIAKLSPCSSFSWAELELISINTSNHRLAGRNSGEIACFCFLTFAWFLNWWKWPPLKILAGNKQSKIISNYEFLHYGPNLELTQSLQASRFEPELGTTQPQLVIFNF